MKEVIQVHHSCIVVSDVEKAVDFYRGILGLEVITTISGKEGKSRLALLKAGDDTIELIQADPAHKLVALQKVGNMHFAFRVSDIHKMYDELTRKGVRFVAPPQEVAEGPLKGWIWCYCYDSDNVQFELIEDRAMH